MRKLIDLLIRKNMEDIIIKKDGSTINNCLDEIPKWCVKTYEITIEITI
jgi:hypothetical protein